MKKDEVKNVRKSVYDIHPIFLNRWSPRAISKEEIPDEQIYTLLEAARWAPSCFNEQPWRFIVAKEEKDREEFLTFLAESNKVWAQYAPALIAVVSKMSFSSNGKPNRWHGFDAGAAWAFLALEGERQGLVVHAMGGFNRTKAKELLHIGEDYDIFAVVAVGKRGDIESLPRDLQEREKPSLRKSLENTVYFGKFL